MNRNNEDTYIGNTTHTFLGYVERKVERRYTFDELHPGYKEVKKLMPDVFGEDYLKYEKLQTEILKELDKVKFYFDYKKDEKIKLNLNAKDLFMVIMHSGYLKNGSCPNLSTYEHVLKPIYENSVKFIDIEYLRMLDLSSICLDGLSIKGLDLSYTNINFDPQKVLKKDLSYANLEGIDFSNKDFSNTFVEGTNFRNCQNLNLDPQKVRMKSIRNTNFENVDMSSQSFDGVIVPGANLEGTNANINPQTLWCKCLAKTNCRGLDLKDKSFNDVTIDGANLDYTNANIDPQKLSSILISYPAENVYAVSPLENGKCYASLVPPRLDDDTRFYYYVQDCVNNPYGKKVEYYNSVYYECPKVPKYCHSLNGTSLRGISFKGKSFKNVDLAGATIDDKFAKIDPQKICHIISTKNGKVVVKSLKNTTIENANLKNKSFNGVIVEGMNLINTNASYDENDIAKDFVLTPVDKSFEIDRLPFSVKRQVLGTYISDTDEKGNRILGNPNNDLHSSVFILEEQSSISKRKSYEEPKCVIGDYNSKIMEKFTDAILQISRDFSDGKYDFVKEEKNPEEKKEMSVKELYKSLRI